MKRKRTVVIGMIAGLLVFGSSMGLAATLGGVNSGSFGADAAAVASCDTDGVATSQSTAYDAADARYEVTGVVVTGINDACDGRTMKVTLTNSSNAALGEATVTIPTDGAATAATANFVSAAAASSVAGVHVVIRPDETLIEATGSTTGHRAPREA